MLSLFISCAATIIVNQTNTWDDIDKRSLAFNKKRCAVKYKYSPCLKYFEKTDTMSYRALCSRSK